MAGLTRYVPVRMTEEEYDRLLKLSKEKQYKTLSEFIRDTLMEHNGIRSRALSKQLYDIEWEINKIGVNINQATKRINSGMGTRLDVKEMLANQQKLNILMQEYIDGVNESWQ